MKPVLARSSSRAAMPRAERASAPTKAASCCAPAAPRPAPAAASGCCGPAPVAAAAAAASAGACCGPAPAPVAAASTGSCCAPSPAPVAAAGTGSCCGPASSAAQGERQWLALWNRIDKPVLAAGLIVLAIALFIPHQLAGSLAFTGESLLGIAPWLALSVAFAAFARASRADTLIARAFVGSPARMVFMGSLFGALSPFCSCGVVPVIAGLLGAGVPLAGVMAFWMSSPIMDPEMFGIIAASLGMEFAIVKTLAAVFLGVFGGILTHFFVSRGLITNALRSGPASCCAPSLPGQAKPDWNILGSRAGRSAFLTGFASNGLFLLRWMVIAFLLESLMVVYLPGEKVASLLGDSAGAIPLAVLLGVPSYLNSYAAIPLVRGLLDLGMNPAVALSFLIGGAVTSIPAATAVWALVRPRVFALYLALAFTGALGAGYAYSALLALR